MKNKEVFNTDQHLICSVSSCQEMDVQVIRRNWVSTQGPS
jgi:hypothetical protein